MSGPVETHGIVVAVDDSSASNAAVSWAAVDAALRNIPLTVIHAVQTPTATWPPVAYPDALATKLEVDGKRAVLNAMKIAQEAMPTDRQVPIKRDLLFSSPGLALIKMSDEAEMIVMGNSGRGLLFKSVLGSVSSNVVRHAKCPVAVVHEDSRDQPGAPVLVGIDGSPASEAAERIAFDEASHRGVDLIVLHAWSDVGVADVPGLDWSAVQADAERSFAESLTGWQERYPDVTVQSVLVRDRPARALIEHAESAQLVVVGKNGRGGMRGMLGSVSHAVLNAVRKPVIVARPK